MLRSVARGTVSTWRANVALTRYASVLGRSQRLLHNVHQDSTYASAVLRATPRYTDVNAVRLFASSRQVEDIYQKKTPIEHVLLRPDMYIGSTERSTQSMFLYDRNTHQMKMRDLVYTPGLYKIFDEILVNAADNLQRDKNTNRISVTLDAENNVFSIYNNGKGIPVVMHKTEKVYVPELVLGQLLTGSNFDDQIVKVTGGRNGYGAKLANIFSTEFEVETYDSRRSKYFKQTWSGNMSIKGEPQVLAASDAPADKTMEDFTQVTFRPDLSKFAMHEVDEGTMALLEKRVFDIAGANPGVTVELNGEDITMPSFADYVKLYVQSAPASNDAASSTTGAAASGSSGDEGYSGDGEEAYDTPIVHQRVNNRWDIAVCDNAGRGTFTHASFVNSIATTRGGTHVNYVADQIAKKVADHVNKKNRGLNVLPSQVKANMMLFIKCLIENPAFDSQTKETLATKVHSFGSECIIRDSFIQRIINETDLVDNVINWARIRQQEELVRKTTVKAKNRLTGIPKLDDANWAGTEQSEHCTLIITEGDSAKALAVAGLGVVGRDKYGVFPLKGKMLNVREASHQQVLGNAEVNSLVKILGLNHQLTYESPEELKSLRYRRVMLMTDQDQDGSHIKGLFINFIHHFWPALLRHDDTFLQEFVTPIVKVTKGKQSQAFYTLSEYENWRKEGELAGGNALKGWNAKYYKGLGTSTAAEGREYFRDLDKHVIDFKYQGDHDDDCIELAFAKARVTDRKTWLSQLDVTGNPDAHVDHTQSTLRIADFINKELIWFSQADNARSIPSVIDGLKPGQRKILYACFKRNLTKEVKVAQLAGYVAEQTAYHHGEMSLNGTIIGMAQNYVGSNNINLLEPNGQFGTRLEGGKDAASPRYIFTRLSPITRTLFPAVDDPLLTYLMENGESIEPQFYLPVLPMVLVNGSEGIGTGWSSQIPNYSPRSIISNILRLLKDPRAELLPMTPWYRGFTGEITEGGDGRYNVQGVMKRDEDSPRDVTITELPVGQWTGPYKLFLESLMASSGSRKFTVRDYQEHHTYTTVNFSLKLGVSRPSNTGGGRSKVKKGPVRLVTTPEILPDQQLIKSLKLQSSLSTTNMHLFDAQGLMKKYTGPEDVIRDFFPVRLAAYERRKAYLLDRLQRDMRIASERAAFTQDVVSGKLEIRNRAQAEILADMAARYSPWSEVSKVFFAADGQGDIQDAGLLDDDDDDDDDSLSTQVSDNSTELVGEAASTTTIPRREYDYLLSTPLWSLTNERVQDLLDQCQTLKGQVDELAVTDPKDMWRADLKAVEAGLSQLEKSDQTALTSELKAQRKSKPRSSAGKRKKK